jgi:hypothetical protein
VCIVLEQKPSHQEFHGVLLFLSVDVSQVWEQVQSEKIEEGVDVIM